MKTHTESRAIPRSQNIARYALGGFMSFAGIAHLTFARQEFQAQVPDWFPLGEDFTVLASGVAEVGLGAALLGFPQRRRQAGMY